MSAFSYVMVLVSIVIGLAIGHVLTAMASAIHRLRGHGEPIRLESVYLIWVGYVVLWLVSFWWWEFKFQDLDIEWSFGLYLFILAYAVALFMLATILVPDEMEGVGDSYAYFMEGRAWFFAANFVVVALDIADTFLKGFDWGIRPVFWAQTGAVSGAFVVGIVSTQRRYQLGAALVAFAAQLLYAFNQIGVLGSW